MEEEDDAFLKELTATDDFGGNEELTDSLNPSLDVNESNAGLSENISHSNASLDSVFAIDPLLESKLNESLFWKEAKLRGYFNKDTSNGYNLTIFIPPNESFELYAKRYPFSYMWNMQTAVYSRQLRTDYNVSQTFITQARMVLAVIIHEASANIANSFVSVGGIPTTSYVNMPYLGCTINFMRGFMVDLRFKDVDFVSSYLPVVPVAASTTEFVELEIKHIPIFLKDDEFTLNVYTCVKNTQIYAFTSTPWSWNGVNRIPITYPGVGVKNRASVIFSMVHHDTNVEIIRFDLPYLITLHPNACLVYPPIVTSTFFDDSNTFTNLPAICLIEGSNFVSSSRVFFGNIEAGVISYNDNFIKAMIPEGSGGVKIAVKNGLFVTYADDVYEYSELKRKKLRQELESRKKLCASSSKT